MLPNVWAYLPSLASIAIEIVWTLPAIDQYATLTITTTGLRTTATSTKSKLIQTEIMVQSNMKVAMYLLLVLAMTTVITNGNPILTEKDSGLNWSKRYYICGITLLRATSIICHIGKYNGVSKDLHSMYREHKDTCCSYPCSLNSLKIFCNEAGRENSGAILY